MATKSVKRGDIVSVRNKNNEIVGRVANYDEQTRVLALEWPEKLGPYDCENPITLGSSEENILEYTTILSPEDIFEKMLTLLNRRLCQVEAEIESVFEKYDRT